MAITCWTGQCPGGLSAGSGNKPVDSGTRLVFHKVYELVKHLYRFVKKRLTNCKDEDRSSLTANMIQANQDGENSRGIGEIGAKLSEFVTFRATANKIA
jgi:hypothetical protein